MNSGEKLWFQEEKQSEEIPFCSMLKQWKIYLRFNIEIWHTKNHLNMLKLHKKQSKPT